MAITVNFYVLFVIIGLQKLWKVHQQKR